MPYDSINGGSVLMGNNIACKTIGIGIIRIKTRDGVVRTLTDVRYIRELNKNFISLGTLDSIGCRFSTKGGVIKVCRCSPIMMKGKKINCLYIL